MRYTSALGEVELVGSRVALVNYDIKYRIYKHHFPLVQSFVSRGRVIISNKS